MKIRMLSNQKIKDGNLILVNAKYNYQELQNTLPALVSIAQNVFMKQEAAVPLSALMHKISGWNRILPVSGWRSVKEQQEIWNRSEAENGFDFTQKFVALPGHSEHQTGLAIDLAIKQASINFICPDFPYTGIGKIFRTLTADYGFIQRYPEKKESITGIGHEPWHFRYVGSPHASIIQKEKLTLEEYIDLIKSFPSGVHPYQYQKEKWNVSVSYLRASPGDTTDIEINPSRPYSISGNNIDGFIVTEWRDRDDNNL